MRHQGERSGISSGSVILGVAILFLVLVGGAGIFYWQQSQVAKRSTPEAVTNEMLGDRTFGRMFRTLQKTHPTDFADLVSRMSELRSQGAPESQVLAQGRQMMAAKSTAMTKTLPQAPAKELAAFRDGQVAVIESLQRHDVDQCARFTMTGLTIDQVDDAATRPLLIDSAITVFEASAAARDRPANRKFTGQLSDADSIALAQALRKQGMTDADLQAFVTPGALIKAPAAQQCSIGLHLWRGISTLESEQAGRITAQILALI
ncbi:MAG: hypothetical protein ABW182_03820 [Sphingomonas sp.]